jgi:hypothetical protein
MSAVPLFSMLDVLGTFVFGLSGAMVAIRKDFDIFCWGIPRPKFCAVCGQWLWQVWPVSVPSFSSHKLTA